VVTGYPSPRTYIHLSNDRCYPPELQTKSAVRVHADVVTVDAGHMAMVTVPDAIATIMNGVREQQ
jgi:hypothetical protein